jgi:transaldolase
MEIYLDTANLKDIKEMNELGIVDGITTNPTILVKEGKDHIKLLKEIADTIKGPVNAEPISQDTAGIVKEAEEFCSLGKNIVAKIAFTKEGLKAVKILSKKGIKTNLTLVFSLGQAIIAAKLGADYVTPFVGRLDDGGARGTDLLEQIAQVYGNYGYKTKIIAASIRSIVHVNEAAISGVDIVTVPKSLLETMIKHPMTELGVKKFIEDWNKK